jgi:diguanylate cyclase (GGDEF)-like protein/PAS domain S-box-containing protein
VDAPLYGTDTPTRLLVPRGPRLGSAVVATALVVVVGLMALAVLDLGGQARLWDYGHWLGASCLGLLLAVRNINGFGAAEDRVRAAVAAAIAIWLLGVTAWIAQGWIGLQAVPAPSDVILLSTLIPAGQALRLAARERLGRGTRLVVYLDGALLFAALAALLLAAVPPPSGSGIMQQAVMILPVGFLALAGAGLLAAAESRARLRDGGLYLLLAGCAMLGFAYLAWTAEAPRTPAADSPSNLLCSIGILLAGAGAATFALPPRQTLPLNGRLRLALDLIPVAAVGWTLAIVAGRAIVGQPALMLEQGSALAVFGIAAVRQGVLVRQRARLVLRERQLARMARTALDDLEEAEQRYRTLVEQIPAIVYLDEPLADGSGRSRFRYVGPQVERLLGVEPSELEHDAELWYTLIHPDDLAGVRAAEEAHFAAGQPLRHEFRMRGRGGQTVWVRDEARLIGPFGARRSHGVLIDVTAEKTFAESLRSSEDQLRRIIETASSAFVSMDEGGVIIGWNQRATDTFGWPADEALGQTVGTLIVPPEYRALHENGLRRAVRGHHAGPVRRPMELTARHRDGREFPVLIRMWSIEHDGHLQFSALIDDISERKRLEDELERQAFHDSLTGLANRALFLDRLRHALRRREAGSVALILADIDDFKLVNDALGHAAGDRVLHELGKRFARLLRPGDTIARWDGDEFAVLVEGTDASAVAKISNRILAAVRTPLLVGDRTITITASVGSVIAGPATGDAQTVLQHADVALTASKRAGKGRAEPFRDEMLVEGPSELEMRSELRTAIEADQLRLLYQPVVELATGRTVGVEALVRWQHPTRGLLGPAEFLHVAERGDLMVTLGRWVLREACRVASTLVGDDEPPWISVNLSPRQLSHPSLPEQIRGALDAAALPPHRLVLELTETSLIRDLPNAAATLLSLKELGIRTAIDDFGTGYSSLSYLAQLPVDILKVDRSFVATIDEDRSRQALVRSIVTLARSLHLELIAEGIETASQRRELRRRGITLGQGYLLALPMPDDQLRAFLA